MSPAAQKPCGAPILLCPAKGDCLQQEQGPDAGCLQPLGCFHPGFSPPCKALHFLFSVQSGITAAMQQRLKRCLLWESALRKQSQSIPCSITGLTELYHPAPTGEHLIWDTEKKQAQSRKTICCPCSPCDSFLPQQTQVWSIPGIRERIRQLLSWPLPDHTLIPASHSSEMSFSRSSRSFFWAEATSTCVSVVLIFSSEA